MAAFDHLPRDLSEFAPCEDPSGTDQRRRRTANANRARLDRLLSSLFPAQRAGTSPPVRVVTTLWPTDDVLRLVLAPEAENHERRIAGAVKDEFGAAIATTRRCMAPVDDGTARSTIAVDITTGFDPAFFARQLPRSCLGWLRLIGWLVAFFVAAAALYMVVVPVHRHGGINGGGGGMPIPLRDNELIPATVPQPHQRFGLDKGAAGGGGGGGSRTI